MQPSSAPPASSRVPETSADTTFTLEYLVKSLKSEDLEELDNAVQLILQQGESVAPALIPYLNSPEEEIRKNIAWVLGYLHAPSSAGALFNSLNSDPSPEVRLSAAWALRHFAPQDIYPHVFRKIPPPRTLQDVIDYLDSKSWKARWYASVLLSQEKVESCLPQLIALAQRDENLIVRCSAILTLMHYPQAESTTCLCELLSDIDDFVKIEAATVLALKNQHSAIPFLLKQLNAYQENVRVSVITALGSLGDQHVIAPLCRMLQDQSDLVRINTAMALLDISQRLRRPHAQMTRYLLKALKDKNTYVVRNAARTLGIVGNESCVPEIITLLKQESQPGIAANLILALGLLSDARAVKILCRQLRSPHWEVRFEAAKALGELKQNQAYGPLLQLLKDTSLLVREQAVHALGRIGNKRAIVILEKMKLQHPYGSLNKAITQALERLLSH
jgi:HEAT repeat protein